MVQELGHKIGEWPKSLFVIQGYETILYALNFTVKFAHYMQNGDTPLLMAVQNGHLAVVKMLIVKYQCSANEVYKVRLSELHLTIQCKVYACCTFNRMHSCSSV